MNDKKEYDEEIENLIKEALDNNPLVMISIDKNGSVSLLTTGNINKIQNNICTKMLITVKGHSLVLSIVLWLEILFEKFLYNMSEFFKRIKNH